MNAPTDLEQHAVKENAETGAVELYHPRVFYSWHSELPNKTNRTFIERALKSARKTLGDEFGTELIVEQAARSEAGAAQIAEAIFRTLDECDAIVADVSIVNRDEAARAAKKGRRLRPSPNLNVLFEAGYAAAAAGWDRLLLVLNGDTGTPEDLPFDIRQRRMVVYHPRAENAAAIFRSQLTGGLREILRKGHRRPFMCWITDEQRVHELIEAYSEAAVMRRPVEALIAGLDIVGGTIGLPGCLLQVASLRRALPLIQQEFHIDDSVNVGTLCELVEAANFISYKLPIGTASDTILPTCQALLKTLCQIDELASVVAATISEAVRSERPPKGIRLPLYGRRLAWVEYASQ